MWVEYGVESVGMRGECRPAWRARVYAVGIGCGCGSVWG